LNTIHVPPVCVIHVDDASIFSETSSEVYTYIYIYKVKGKGKCQPTTDHEGPEVE